MALDRSGLVLFHDYTTGTLEDFSGNGLHGTFVNGMEFVRGSKGWGIQDTSGLRTGYVQVAHNDLLNLDAMTIVVVLEGNDLSDHEGDVFVAKGVSNFTTMAYSLRNGFPGLFGGFLLDHANNGGAVYNATNQMTKMSLASESIGMTKPAGDSAIEYYSDGMYNSDGLITSATIDILNNTEPLAIGGPAGAAYAVDKRPIYAVLIYNEVKTSDQMRSIHDEVKLLQTAHTQKRNFTSVGTIEDQQSVSLIRPEVVDGKVYDLGTGKNHGDAVNVDQERNVLGRPALRFDGSTSHIDCGNDSSLDFTDETFMVSAWVKKGTLSGFHAIAARNTYNVGGYGLLLTSVGNIRFETFTPTQSFVDGNVPLRDDTLHYVCGVAEKGGNLRVYLDGVEVSSSVVAHQDITAISQDFVIGAHSAKAANFFPGQIGEVEVKTFSSLSACEGHIKKTWNAAANTVIYQQDFEDAHLQSVAVASGEIEGTDMRVVSVNGLVGGDSSDKHVTSASVGSILGTPGVRHSFGVIKMSCTPVTGARCRHAQLDGGTFAIIDVGDGGNNRIAYTTSTGGVVFTNSAAFSTDKQEITIKKRTTSTTNNTTIEKDSVQVGSAFTDTLVLHGERQLAVYSNVRIHNIKHYFGVPLT